MIIEEARAVLADTYTGLVWPLTYRLAAEVIRQSELLAETREALQYIADRGRPYEADHARAALARLESPMHVCDVASCEEAFATMPEVVAHERTHRLDSQEPPRTVANGPSGNS